MKLTNLFQMFAILATLIVANPIPQVPACGDLSIARRTPTPTDPTISDIFTSDPCLPSTYKPALSQSFQTTSIASVKAQGFFSWLHHLWDAIRKALAKIKDIKITIPWSVIEGWLDKLQKEWTIIMDPDNEQGVVLVPPPGSTAQPLRWSAPVPVVVKPLPEKPCGGKTGKMCP